jgi:homoserine O-acetyltransferase
MLSTWQRADISDNPTYARDFTRSLAAIEARAIIMPVSTDLYFPVEDSQLEVAQLGRAELRIIDSPWGHIAGGPDRNPAASAVIERAIQDLLSTG